MKNCYVDVKQNGWFPNKSEWHTFVEDGDWKWLLSNEDGELNKRINKTAQDIYAAIGKKADTETLDKEIDILRQEIGRLKADMPRNYVSVVAFNEEMSRSKANADLLSSLQETMKGIVGNVGAVAGKVEQLGAALHATEAQSEATTGDLRKTARLLESQLSEAKGTINRLSPMVSTLEDKTKTLASHDEVEVLTRQVAGLNEARTKQGNLDKVHAEVTEMAGKMKQLACASFGSRLKWLFTGRV